MAQRSIASKLDAISPAGRIKELEALVEKQQQHIERLRSAKFTLPTGKKRKAGSTFVRVIIPDSHGAHIDKPAAAAFLNDLERLKPAQIVRLGDHLDCGGFLALHHTLGFVPETSYSFEEDCAAANAFLDETQKRAQPEEDYYIIGNHEQRIEKWIINQTLRNPKDSAYLHRMFSPESVLHFGKRGIKEVKRNEQYSGLQKRGTIKLGKCLFHHGTRTGLYAAKRNLDDVGTNICFGHTHRIACYVKETADGIIGSWSYGCLCDLHPLYGDTNTSDWANGYGVHIVRDTGEFMSITVPIIDGVSYLDVLAQGFAA